MIRKSFFMLRRIISSDIEDIKLRYYDLSTRKLALGTELVSNECYSEVLAEPSWMDISHCFGYRAGEHKL